MVRTTAKLFGSSGLLIGLALLAGLVVGTYFLIGWAADAIATSLPDTVERQMFGDLGKRQSGWRAKATTPRQERAEQIFERLRRSGKLRDLPYELYFTPEKSPNAYALPGGSLAVTDGLLSLVKGDVGLAVVIGHELGHQQHRHSLKRMGRSLLTATVVALVIGETGLATSLALELGAKAYGRDHELEADAFGLKLAHRAFGTTKGALEFFQKLETDPANRDSKLLSMLSTHPYTPDRIKRLKALARALEARSSH